MTVWLSSCLLVGSLLGAFQGETIKEVKEAGGVPDYSPVLANMAF